MADQDTPNKSSDIEKAEGDRAGADQYDGTSGAGITNRPIDEEIANQEAVPERGERKPGAHAG
jgi:hypothetical protein